MENEIDKSKLELIPAIGLSCTGCELREYAEVTEPGQTAKCLKMVGSECLKGFIWTNKK